MRGHPKWLPIFAALMLMAATAFAADVVVAPSYAAAPPSIDGIVSPGEWSAATTTTLAHGKMHTMNDGMYLYVLLDIADDTTAETPPLTPFGAGDYFTLA